MRLTLRTMLAYLDDVLEPGDAQDLGHKIEESKFASEIVARIRNSTRRPRLGAPRIDARGMGGDPNTVAEYLDNVLPADRVPEFEKVCLESDVHLAETAACHQILTLVLGQPAEVEGSTRERIHKIGSPAPTAGSAAATSRKGEEPPVAAAAVAAPPVGSGDISPRLKPEVPDYLREEPQGRWWQFLLVLCLVFVLCATVIVAMGPLNHEHPMAPMLGLAKPADQQPVAKNPDEKETKPLEPKTPEKKGEETTPEEKTEKKSTEVPVEPVTPMPMPEVPPAIPVDPNATKSLPVDPAPMPRPMPAPVAPTNPADMIPAVPVNPTVPAVPADPSAPVPPPAEVKPANDAGRYISEDEVLLIPNGEKGWRRLAPREALASGTRVLALPSYRPNLLLAGGAVQVILDGGSLAVIHAPVDGVSQVQLEYGRAIILTVGVAGAPVRLIAGRTGEGRTGLVVFGDAESQVAVEVKRVLDQGADPQEAIAHRLVELHTTSGNITWTEGDQRGIPVGAGHIYRMLDAEQGRAEAAEQIADWVTGKNADSVEQLASKALKEVIPAKDDKVAIKLKELAISDRRAEVRSLAVRCLAHLGDYDAFAAAFNDADQRSSWPLQFDLLQACLAQGKEEAVAIKESLERSSTADGASLYRMLWGYNAEDLKKDEGAKKLVENLDHANLPMRVLAFENLRRITGMTQYYRPEYPAPRRKQYIQKWKERLVDGGIAPIKPGAPMPRTPGPAPAPRGGAGGTLPLPEAP